MLFIAILALESFVGAVVWVFTRALLVPGDVCDHLPSYTGSPLSSGMGHLLPPNNQTIIAFLADQGHNVNSFRVLDLIRNEGARVVFHVGDFDYEGSPSRWGRMVENRINASSYFAVLGNHEVEVNGIAVQYAYRVKSLHKEAAECCCDGKVAARALCIYEGIAFVQSGTGNVACSESSGAKWITEQFNRLDDRWRWRFCLFHKNHHLMQMGGKQSEIGWGPYEACRRAGAIVVTGHDHRYARTHIMSSFENQIVVVDGNSTIKNGRSMVLLVGLGGHSIRTADHNLRQNPWWADSLSAGDANANFGALFCQINGRKAQCYFKTIGGVIIDDFQIQV